MGTTATPAETAPVSDLTYGELQAVDFYAMAELGRHDDTVARMLADYPAPIIPQHHYPQNGAAMAMVRAIQALRPLAVKPVSFTEQHDHADGHRSTVWVYIPMRSRRLSLYVPLNAVAGFDGRFGVWRWNDALLDELHRDEQRTPVAAPPRVDLLQDTVVIPPVPALGGGA